MNTMKTLFLSIACLIFFQTFGQDTLFYTHAYEKVFTREEAHIYRLPELAIEDGRSVWKAKDYLIQTNQMVLEGTFKSVADQSKEGRVYWYYENGNPKEESYFENNKRNGLCKWYHENGNLKEQSLFVDGERRGISKIYFENGENKTHVLYESGKEPRHLQIWTEDGLSFLKDGTGTIEAEHPTLNGKWFKFYQSGYIIDEYVVREDGQKIYLKVEKDAEPMFGYGRFFSYLKSKKKYPKAAKKNKTEGKVLVEFVVAPDGRITEVQVVEGFDSACDAEAVRLFQNANAWKPAKHNNENVYQALQLPVQFKLNE